MNQEEIRELRIEQGKKNLARSHPGELPGTYENVVYICAKCGCLLERSTLAVCPAIPQYKCTVCDLRKRIKPITKIVAIDLERETTNAR